MRLLLRLLCGFTVVASTWLVTMYVVLGNPGYERRATVAAGFVVASLVTLGVLQLARPAGWMRAVAIAAGAGLVYAGASALASVLAPGAHFEGYAVVIAIALLGQGVLTPIVLLSGRRRAASPQ